MDSTAKEREYNMEVIRRILEQSGVGVCEEMPGKHTILTEFMRLDSRAKARARAKAKESATIVVHLGTSHESVLLSGEGQEQMKMISRNK